MSKNKYLKILVGLLLMLNIVVLSFIAFKRPSGPMPPPGKHPMERDLLKKLNFSDEQLSSFESSKEEYIQQSRALSEELNIASREYYGAHHDASIRMEAHKEIMTLTNEIYEVNLKHFDDLRSLCSLDQIDEMEEFISTIMDSKKHRPQKMKRK